MAELWKIAIIYYSATGNVHGLAQAVAEGAEGAGAEVRLGHVEELASHTAHGGQETTILALNNTLYHWAC